MAEVSKNEVYSAYISRISFSQHLYEESDVLWVRKLRHREAK